MLRIYDDNQEKFSPVYFSFDYIETDIRKDDLYTKMTCEGKQGRLVDADYFVVALGSDEDNLEIADKIKRYVNRAKLEKYNNDPCKTTVCGKIPVAYVVFDDALNDLLSKAHDQDDENSFVDMYPFGSLGETYSYGQVTLDGIRKSAERVGDSYQKMLSEVITSEKQIQKYYADSYSYWAVITRAIHIKYKAFSVGISTERYLADAKDPNNELNSNAGLAWLEHRRWTAFMRVSGFRAPTPNEEYGYIQQLPDISNPKDETNRGKHKNLPLKLHPCIVECEDSSRQSTNSDDRLDAAAKRLRTKYPSKNLMVGDFKKRDYPIGDYH